MLVGAIEIERRTELVKEERIESGVMMTKTEEEMKEEVGIEIGIEIGTEIGIRIETGTGTGIEAEREIEEETEAGKEEGIEIEEEKEMKTIMTKLTMSMLTTPEVKEDGLLTRGDVTPQIWSSGQSQMASGKDKT